MKKKIVIISVLVVVAVIVGLNCNCLSSNSKSESISESTSEAVAKAESTSEAESKVEMGNATAESTIGLTSEVVAPIEVKGVDLKVEGDKITMEASMSFALLLWMVYKDAMFRVCLIIFFLMWYTGNLMPNKNLSFWDKK